MNAQEIVNILPQGYRWATEAEVARCMHPVYFNKTVQVWNTQGEHTFLSLAILDTTTKN